LRNIGVFIREKFWLKNSLSQQEGGSSVGAGPSTETPSFLLAQAIFEPYLFCINTPTFLEPSHSSYLPAYKDGTDSVPKRRHMKFRCQGITQKKACNIQNMAKV